MNQGDQRAHDNRVRQLDVLRAVAIFLVIGHHMYLIPLPILHVPVVGPLIQAWKFVGWMGVDLFFVLSGFLVSGLIFTEFKKYSAFELKRFLIRRGFKIYPAYYFFTFIGLITMPWILLDFGKYLRPFVCELCFLQSYGPKIWAHTWSLAVEEHFYFLCGFMLLFLSKRKTAFRPIPIIVLVVLIAVCAMRFLTELGRPGDTLILYWTHLRIDGLFLGMGLSYIYHFKREMLDKFVKPRVKLLFIASLILIAPCALFATNSLWAFSFGLSALSLGFAALIVCSLYGLLPAKGRAIDFLSWIGFYSYSIYLWHQPVYVVVALLVMLIKDANLFFCVALPTYVVFSVVVGMLMARWIERPFLRLRDKWYPSRSEKLASPSTSVPTG